MRDFHAASSAHMLPVASGFPDHMSHNASDFSRGSSHNLSAMHTGSAQKLIVLPSLVAMCLSLVLCPCWLPLHISKTNWKHTKRMHGDAAGDLPIGSKESQDLAWSRAVKFLKQNLA